MPISIPPGLLGSLPPQTPPIQPRGERSYWVHGPALASMGAGRSWSLPSATRPSLLPQLSGPPQGGLCCCNWPRAPCAKGGLRGEAGGPRQSRSREGVHRGAGPRPRLSQLEDPESGVGWRLRTRWFLAPPSTAGGAGWHSPAGVSGAETRDGGKPHAALAVW